MYKLRPNWLGRLEAAHQPVLSRFLLGVLLGLVLYLLVQTLQGRA